jgi:hypothetical protein
MGQVYHESFCRGNRNVRIHAKSAYIQDTARAFASQMLKCRRCDAPPQRPLEGDIRGSHVHTLQSMSNLLMLRFEKSGARSRPPAAFRFHFCRIDRFSLEDVIQPAECSSRTRSVFCWRILGGFGWTSELLGKQSYLVAVSWTVKNARSVADSTQSRTRYVFPAGI